MYERIELAFGRDELEWLLLGISKNEILGLSLGIPMSYILLFGVELERKILYNGGRGV